MESQLERILTKYQREPEQLIAILREAQQIKGWLSRETQDLIAQELDLPAAEVNGVVTFYNLFQTQPQGKNQIRVCLGTACYVRGGAEIKERLAEELGLAEGQECTPDGLISLHTARCMGACSLAPAVSLGEDLKGNFSVQEVPKLIRQIRKEAGSGQHEQSYLGTDSPAIPARP